MNNPRPRGIGEVSRSLDSADWRLYPLVEEPLARPIDIYFGAMQRALSVLDFGRFAMDAKRGVIAGERGGMHRRPRWTNTPP
jgi:hypothetical protein